MWNPAHLQSFIEYKQFFKRLRSNMCFCFSDKVLGIVYPNIEIYTENTVTMSRSRKIYELAARRDHFMHRHTCTRAFLHTFGVNGWTGKCCPGLFDCNMIGVLSGSVPAGCATNKAAACTFPLVVEMQSLKRQELSLLPLTMLHLSGKMKCHIWYKINKRIKDARKEQALFFCCLLWRTVIKITTLGQIHSDYRTHLTKETNAESGNTHNVVSWRDSHLALITALLWVIIFYSRQQNVLGLA